MKKALQIFLFTTVCYSASFAQTYTLYGDKSYGSINHDHVPSVVNLNDGTFMIASYSFGTVSGDKTAPSCDTVFNPIDIWLLKVDTAFNIIWNKCYGGSDEEYQPYIIKTQNANKFIITSASSSDSSCQKTSDNKGITNEFDYWVLSIDSNGNPVSDQSWGAGRNDAYPQSIELNSGNFITCGVSNSPVSGDKSASPYDTLGNGDYWVVKTDSLGNKLWDKVYGGTGKEYDNLGTYENMFKVLADKNDAFILAGTTDSPLSGDISDSSRGMKDIWIIKIDSAGNKVWDKRYGGSGNEQCNYIMHTADNGYLVCGSTASPQGGDVSDSSKGGVDCWIIKLDSIGNKQWDKRYGGNQTDDATWIEKAPDGGYWISGLSASDSSGDVTEPKYGNFSDYWIFKIDDAGNKLWDKRYGGPGLNYGSTFTIMPDSSIFLFGASFPGTSAVKTDYGKGQQDIWVVHFKYICATAATINAVDCDSYTSPSGNYNWTASGIYNDTLQNAAGCDSIITINLTINTVDTSVTQIWNTLTANATGATYQWVDCDSSYAVIPGATSQSITPSEGNYAVVVTENGCTDTSSCYYVMGDGIDEKENEGILKVHPNPVRDVLILSFKKTLHTNNVISISDIQGRLIKEESIVKYNNKDISIDVSTLSQGVYLLKVNENIHRFVKM